MLDAVERFNASKDNGGRPFTPVRRAGRTWTGQPGSYEKLCHGTFTDSTDRVVDLLQPDVYRSLQQSATRWSAFNAWLLDPPIQDGVLRGAIIEGDRSLSDAVDSGAACPAAQKLQATLTGTPTPIAATPSR